jgi:hypothetical protein
MSWLRQADDSIKRLESGSSVDFLLGHRLFCADQEYLLLGSGMLMKKSCAARVLEFHPRNLTPISVQIHDANFCEDFRATFIVMKEALGMRMLSKKLRRSFSEVRAQGRRGGTPA